MSEAGQIDFAADTVISRDRVKSGGTLYYDHVRGRSFNTVETLEDLAGRKDYAALLKKRGSISPIFRFRPVRGGLEPELNVHQRMVACSLNQESLKLLMDPMLRKTAQRKSRQRGTLRHQQPD